MIVGVPREVFPGERRVALVPESLRRLTASKISAWVEAGAGPGRGVQRRRVLTGWRQA